MGGERGVDGGLHVVQGGGNVQLPVLLHLVPLTLDMMLHGTQRIVLRGGVGRHAFGWMVTRRPGFSYMLPVSNLRNRLRNSAGLWVGLWRVWQTVKLCPKNTTLHRCMNTLVHCTLQFSQRAVRTSRINICLHEVALALMEMDAAEQRKKRLKMMAAQAGERTEDVCSQGTGAQHRLTTISNHASHRQQLQHP